MNKTAIRALLVDPDDNGKQYLERELQREGHNLLPSLKITPVTDPAAAADALDQSPSGFDIIITRERGGGKGWLQQCIMLGEGGLPIICLVPDPVMGEKSLELGAHDYAISGHSDARRLAHLLTLAADHSHMQRQITYMDEQLQASEERFRSVVIPTIDGALIVDVDGIIQFANGAAQGILGKSLTDLLGAPFELPLVPYQIMEINHKGLNDEHLIAEVRTVETVWEGGAAYLVIVRDITAQSRTDQALRRVSGANNRLLKAFNTLNTGVVITDPNLPDNPMIYVNPACTQLTGYSQEDMLGQSIRMFQGVETDPVITEHIRASVEDNRSFHGIILHYRKNGEKFWDELVLNPVFDEYGNLTNFIGLLDDVTDRVQAMEQLHHRRRIEGLVTSTSSEFVNMPPEQIDVAINRTLQRLGRFIGADRCNVVQIGEEGQRATITHEWVEEGVLSLRNTTLPFDIASMTWLFPQLKRLESVQVNDIEQLPVPAMREKQLLRATGVKSMLTVPMSSDNKFVGYLGFATLKQQRSWSDADIALLKVIGEIIFGAMKRSRTEQALRQSEERFRSVVANTPMLIFSFDSEGIITFVQGKAMLSMGLENSLLDQSIFELYRNSPDVIANCKRVLRGETFLGTMSFETTPDNVFETWYTPILNHERQIVGGSAVAIDISERYRAQSAEREQRAMAEALRDTASALTRSLDPEQVMQEILENVHRVVPHDAASIVLNGYPNCPVAYMRGRSSELIHGRTGDDGEPPLQVPAELDTFSYMRTTGKALLIPDTRRYKTWVRLPELEWINSFLGVPIQLQSTEIIGFLTLDSATPDFFNEIHVGRIQAFADQAALAIQNAQLYDQVRSDAQQMFVLNRATSFLFTALSETSDVEALCNQIAEAVVHEFGKVDCSVVLVEETADARQLNRVARAGQYQARVNGEPDDYAEQVITSGDTLYQPQLDGTRDDARTRSRFIIPLRSSGNVIGVLDVRSLETDAFDEQERRMLEGFSGRAAMTIENARLYKRVRSYAEALEERVRERTLDLDQARTRLNTILNSMDEAVIAWEATDAISEPKIRFVNGAFSQIFGYSEDQIASAPDFYRLLTSKSAEADRLMRIVQEGTRTTEFVRTETKLLRADGVLIDTLLTATRLRVPPRADGEDTPLEIAGVVLIRDIRQEKALQEQRDRFIANASHELRTPLANLKLRLYLLKHQPDKMAEHVAIIEQVSQRMQELVEDLLDHTRFERGLAQLNREDQCLQDLIRAVLRLQGAHADEKSIELRVQMPEQEVYASVDGSRLTQVITNLVVNAINYTPQGGAVKVSLETMDQGDQPQAILRIQDSGIGIPQEIQEQIFKPFYRANDGTTRGTGLGLTIAREIVMLHGGSIHLESMENVGTTFTVILPLYQEVAALG